MTWRNTVLGIANGDTSQDEYRSFLANMWDGILGWVVDVGTVVIETMSAWLHLPGNSVPLSSAIDQNYQAMQCVLMSGGSRETVLNGLYAIIDGMPVNFWMKYDMKKIMSYIPVTAVYTNIIQTSASIPEAYFARGCPECGTLALVPDAPDGYTWTKWFYTLDHVTNDAIYSASDNVVTVSGGNTNLGRPWCYMVADGAAILDDAGLTGGEIVGVLHIVTINEKTPDNLLELNSVMGGSGDADMSGSGVFFRLYDNYQSDLQALYDSFIATDKAWSAGAFDLSDLDVTHQNAGGPPWSMDVDIETWALIKN